MHTRDDVTDRANVHVSHLAQRPWLQVVLPGWETVELRHTPGTCTRDSRKLWLQIAYCIAHVVTRLRPGVHGHNARYRRLSCHCVSTGALFESTAASVAVHTTNNVSTKWRPRECLCSLYVLSVCCPRVCLLQFMSGVQRAIRRSCESTYIRVARRAHGMPGHIWPRTFVSLSVH